jgi:hypothetical protein
MPIKMYSFKEGSRSTPKLRRNQSSWKCKQNPSVDSFTSLRPNSLGLAQTLPGSPADLGTPTSPLLWQEYSSTRPVVHMSNEAEPSLPSPPLMSPPNFSPASGTYNAPGRTDARRTFTTVSTTALDGFKSDPIVAERNHGAHIISLGLLPNQVGLVRSEGHTSNIVQIYIGRETIFRIPLTPWKNLKRNTSLL